MHSLLGHHALLLLGLAAALVLAVPAGGAPAAPQADLLTGLRQAHPRIMLTDERLKELKAREKQDPLLQRYVKDVLAEADGLLDAKPLEHVIPDGLRLLSTSRNALRRISTLSLAYRWTGDRRYYDAAVRDLKAVCAFEDWNPRHFLDTAEMSNAVGIGYDWLYNSLDEATRTTIHDALIRLGLTPGLQAYRGEKYSFPRVENNWSQVCNFGLSVGALAIADTDRAIAQEILAGAVASLPRAMRNYAPDGAWMEGPGYWNYATSYCAYGMSALDTALGNDLETSKYPGFGLSGFFPIYGAGPTGCYLSYADAGMMSRSHPQACLFYLAGKYQHPEFADAEHDALKSGHASAFDIAWYQPPSGQSWKRDLDRYFNGPVQVALFRSAWGDPNALWVGFKSGYNQVPHGHLDLGNFELDALGVRWAVDLGSDDYNMPGYWDGKEGGQRWSYYRLNSHSHNVCLLDDKDQPAAGTATFTRWYSSPDAGAAVVDMTKAYRDVTSAARGVQLLRKQGVIVVQDELVLPAPRDLTWGMTTRADIQIQENGSAILTQGEKKLRVTATSFWVEGPGNGAGRTVRGTTLRFEVGSAERQKPEAENKGMRRLLIPLKGVSGEQRIAVFFTPEGNKGAEGVLKPLAEWPGEAPK